MMGPNNLVYSTYSGRGNVNIAARYTIENLVISKNCVNTHTHTHTHSHRQYSRVNLYNFNESAKWLNCYFAWSITSILPVSQIL